jgi:chromosome segregation ATPase
MPGTESTESLLSSCITHETSVYTHLGSEYNNSSSTPHSSDLSGDKLYIQELLIRLEIERSKTVNAEAALHDALKSIDALSAQLEAQRTKTCNLEAELQHVSNTMDKLRSETCLLRIEFKAVLDAGEQAERERDEARAEIEVRRAECDAAHGEASKAWTEAEEAKREVLESDMRRERQRERYEDLVQTLQVAFGEKENVLRDFELDMLTQYARAESLQAELAEAHARVEYFKEEANTLRKRNEELQQRERVFHKREKVLVRKIEALTADKENAEDRERLRFLEGQTLRQQRRRADQRERQNYFEAEALRKAKDHDGAEK